jgi:hypothetical protein
MKQKKLTAKQALKLKTAAMVLKVTSSIYNDLDENDKKTLLPLWGGGVVTHGLPKCFVIGRSKKAIDSKNKQELTMDHLYRVTATADYILRHADKCEWDINRIQEVLLQRSLLMIVTKEQNRILKNTVKHCDNQDDWEELYDKAGIEYDIFQSKANKYEALKVLTSTNDKKKNNLLSKEANYRQWRVRQLPTRQIEVFHEGQLCIPALPALLELARILNVPAVNRNGNPKNTQQLGSNIIQHLSPPFSLLDAARNDLH